MIKLQADHADAGIANADNRRSGRLRRLALCGVAAAALMPGAAPAQTASSPASVAADSQAAGAADEIIVTAQKRNESINSVPASIVAATGAQLAARGITEVRDLDKLVAGFTYTESQNGTPIYTLRGVGFSDTSIGGRPTVSIYNDEAPVPFSIETRGAQLDLERVEVLKGPQGTLFGQNATGGAINYVAAKPTDHFEAGITLGAARFDTIKAAAFVSGPLSDTLRARIAVDQSYQGDWQRSYTSNAELGAGRFLTGRTLLDWTPDSRLSIRLNLNGFHDTRDQQAPQLINVNPSVPPAVGLVPGLANYPHAPANARAADWYAPQDFYRNNTFIQANGRIDFELTPAVKLTSLTSYSHYKQDQRFSNTGTNLPTYVRSRGKVDTIFQELRVAGSLAGRGNFILGANYERDKVFQGSDITQQGGTIQYSFVGLGLPVFTNFFESTDQKSRSGSVFGNLDYKLTDTIRVQGGVRYTKSRTEFTGCSYDSGDGVASADFIGFYNFLRGRAGLPALPPAPPGACLTSGPNISPLLADNTLREHNVSWRAGIDWKPTPATMLYFNVSRGFKQGNFPDLGATQVEQYSAATQEQLTSYEAGFKTHALTPGLQINGAVFHYDYRDKQVFGYFVDRVFGPINRLVNIPKSRINGAELEVSWRIVEGLTFNANGSYISSKILDGYTNFNALAQRQNFGGQPFPNTPKWSAAGSLDYRFPLSGAVYGFVGGDVTYQGATNSQLGQQPLTSVKAHTLIDLRAGVEAPDGKWRLSVYGRNITNEYYWTAAYRITDTTVRYAGLPVTYGVTAAYRF